MDVTNYPRHECVDCVHYAACPCQWELNSETCKVIAVIGEDDDEADLYLQDQ